MTDTIHWPAIPAIKKGDPQAEVKKILFQAKVDIVKAEREAAIAREKAQLEAGIASDQADWANEYAQTQAVQNAYLEVAKGNLDRATAKATFVQGAAAAVSSAYVAILGLSFAGSQGTSMPARGIVPTIFLGTAIFLAAAYSSFLTKLNDVQVLASDGTLQDSQRQRRNSFILWTRAPTLARRFLLQTSIISLGIGALLLPVPFLAISDLATVYLAVAGLIIVILTLIISWILSVKERSGSL